MDTAQSSHEKRSIKVKDFLQDFRSGMPDRDLMERYDLSATGLEKFYNMLLDRNIIDIAEFEDRVEHNVSSAYDHPLPAEDKPIVDALLIEPSESVEATIPDPPKVAAADPEPLYVEASEPAGDASEWKGPENVLDRFEDAWEAAEAVDVETAEDTRFICPSCLYSQEAAFDTCPDCGISVSDYFEHENSAQLSDPRALELDSESELIFAEDASHYASQEDELVFTDEELFPRSANDFKADSHRLQPAPIEIPLSDEAATTPSVSLLNAFEREDFFCPAEPQGMRSDFAEAADDALPAFPLADEGEDKTAGPRCQTCSDTLEPEVRRIYDRKGAMSAFSVAVVSLVLGCLGAAALAIFDEYSLIRVVLIYATGLTMLLGTVFLGLALFMLFFAQEKVYVCTGCHRTYPRL